MRFGLFLVNSRSAFQNRQREAAQAAARSASVTLDTAFGEDSSAAQRRLLFAYIRELPAPSAIIIEPVEDPGIRYVLREALERKIGCALLNRTPTWVSEEGRKAGGLAFCVTADQVGIGCTQGAQYKALLPRGGMVLYITGPPMASASAERWDGMESTCGALISVTKVVGDWTEQSGYDAVKNWLDTTRGLVKAGLVGSQNDEMAVGASKALAEMALTLRLPELRTIPVLGVDGVPEFGQRLVQANTLAATIVMPTTAGQAVELLAAALSQGSMPPPVCSVPVASYPSLAELGAKH